jgi:hypothetical protein
MPTLAKFWQNWFKHEVKHYCLWSTNSLILVEIRKNCLISGRKLLLCQFTKKGNNTDCSNYCGISLLSTSYKMLLNILLSWVSSCVEEGIGDHQCVFQLQLLITLSAFHGVPMKLVRLNKMCLNETYV